MAVFSNSLRLTELATGEGSGTWGETTNSNLELIAESFSFGTEAITTNADTHTTTIADGSTDPGRSIFLKYTGTLDSACTITIGPNTVSKLWLIENATSGSQSIIIKQGSGATITVPNGQTKAIYSDGAGSGGAMVDAFQDLSIPDLFIDDDLTIGDDLVFSSDSAVITFGADGDTTLTHTDGSGLTLNSTNKIMFNDASQFIQGSSATVLSLGATDEIDLTATLIDINGNADVSGTVTATGTSVFASLDISGDIDVDGTTNLDVVDIDGAVDMASTLTTAGDISINAGSGNPSLTIKTAGAGNNPHVNYRAGDNTVFDTMLVASAATDYWRVGYGASGSVTSEFLAVTSAGNVGIGTTSPTTFSGFLTVHQKNASGNAIHLVETDGGVISQIIANDANSGEVFIGARSNHPLLFTTNDTERMRIDSSGNVGIGVSSPGAKLEVNGSVITARNNGAAYLIDRSGFSTSPSYAFFGNDTTGIGNPSAGVLGFSTAGSEAMRIDSSGNVGIGSSSPDTLLNLAGDETAVIRLENTNGSASDGDVIGALQFYKTDGSGAGAGVVGQVKMLTQGVGSGGHLTLSTGDSSANDVERLRITSNGNVGIGCTPSRNLSIQGTGDTVVSIFSPAANQAALFFGDTDSDSVGRVAYDNSDNSMRFTTNASEAMRIDSSGNLLVNTTSSGQPNENYFQARDASGFQVAVGHADTVSNGQPYFYMTFGGVAIGSITQATASSVAFNTSSDQRLKNNIVDAPSASADIDAIQVRSFDWKADGSHQKYGMVAQELQSVAPEAVSAPEDPEEMMGVDYSKLVPMLVKEIQSLRARVQQLENN